MKDLTLKDSEKNKSIPLISSKELNEKIAGYLDLLQFAIKRMNTYKNDLKRVKDLLFTTEEKIRYDIKNIELVILRIESRIRTLVSELSDKIN